MNRADWAIPLVGTIIASVMILSFVAILSGWFRGDRGQLPTQTSVEPPTTFSTSMKVQKVGETTWGTGAITNYRSVFRVDYEGKTYLVFDRSGVILHEKAQDD